MKILYIIHQFYPEYHTGTEKFVLNLASMSQKAGNKVKVITYSFLDDSNFDKDDGNVLYRNYSYQGIPVLAFKLKKQPDDIHITLENKYSREFASKILIEESPDLVHVGHPMRVHEFIWEALNIGIPYVITLTDFFMICPKYILAPDGHSLCSGPQGGNACKLLCKEFSGSFIKKRLAQSEKLLTNAKAVISPSKFLARMINNEFENLGIKIINHGIDQNHIKQNQKIYDGNSSIVFGYAGSLIHHKGVYILLKAFNQICSENVKLEIYGSGLKIYEDNLKKSISNNNKVTFHGKYAKEQLGEIMENIDVLITPSIWYENYPLVLHEALASGVPVIATNLGGMAEKIKYGKNGLTFNFGDSEDLQKKIQILIDNPLIINQMKEFIQNKMIIPKVEQEAYKYNLIYKNYQKPRTNGEFI